MTDLSKNALVMMEGVSKKDTVFTSASHSEHVRPMLMVGDQSRIRNSMLWVHLYKEIGPQNKTDFLDIMLTINSMLDFYSYIATLQNMNRYYLQLTWTPFLAVFSITLQDCSDVELIAQCLAGFKCAVRVACIFKASVSLFCLIETIAPLFMGRGCSC